MGVEQNQPSSTFGANSSSNKLPHGLTVHELKEMTKARLQAEAAEKWKETFNENVVYHHWTLTSRRQVVHPEIVPCHETQLVALAIPCTE